MIRYPPLVDYVLIIKKVTWNKRSGEIEFKEIFNAFSTLQYKTGGWSLQTMSKLRMFIKIT